MALKARPILTLFCGLPGSGKTTVAKRIEAECGSIRICTDDWQEALGVPHVDEDFHQRLQTQLYSLALELLRHGVHVILEDGLWTQPERTQKLTDARSLDAKTHLHFFDLDLRTLKDRVERRNAALPAGAVPINLDDLSHWHQAVFQRPDALELALFDEVTIHR